jgi:quinoprotein glucose dehydrogenase
MFVLFAAAFAFADDYTPFVHGPSKEAEQAMSGFQPAPGVTVDLVAAEPLLANPVCFTIDRTGRFFVAETFRLHQGVTDTRGHMYWLDDDLACRTVADRVAKYKKWLGAAFPTYGTEHDRIKVLWNSKGDSLKPDQSAVFADGFKNVPDGIGSGILVRDDAVYWSCIPDLWKLAPTKAGEKSSKRESLSYGWGVHTGFLGHDLHGLTLGPDGRIYFSIGDRGFKVKTKEGTILNNPDSGAVLRCEQDGTKLEIFASGLRNPQELAFDDEGNLFTCDNNSDGGDQARWLHLVEGGDYGWRMGYQYHDEPTPRGPWNNEMLWKPDVGERAAYLIPPLKNFSDGPSGIAYNPGVTRLGDKWKNAFFLCDFRGTPNQSGIRAVWLKPKGAGFEFDRDDRIVWQSLVTDCEFGPDGGLYFSDWVDGWSKPNKGRIYRLLEPSRNSDPRLDQMQKMFKEGFSHRSPAELLKLLEHPDRRIRQEAQEALVKQKAVTELSLAAESTWAWTVRPHGVWGLGHMLRTGVKSSDAVAILIRRLYDEKKDPRMLRAAAIALAEAGEPAAINRIIELIAHEDPTVRRDAAFAVRRFGRNEKASHAIMQAALSVNRLDAVQRHALSYALSATASPELLRSAMEHQSGASRTIAILAMRIAKDPNIAGALTHSTELEALEAARAIYDNTIEAALPALADHAKAPKHWIDPFLRRVAAANFRLGKPENAGNLARLATGQKTPNSVRKECLYELAHWAKPNGKDRVLGNWWPIAPRSAEPAAAALKWHMEKLLAATKLDVDSRRMLMEAVRLLEAKDLLADVRKLAADETENGVVRTEALKTLAELNDASLAEIVKKSLQSKDADLRSEARRHLASIDPAAAVPALEEVLASGGRFERQAALATLATIQTPTAEAALLDAFDRLRQGKFPKDAELDLLLAAEAKGTPALKAQLQSLAAGRKKDDPLAEYRACLEGGDPRNGKKIFDTRADVYCLRCHKVGSAGGEVGPKLADIGKTKSREYLLEAIVTPNAKIAEGFESVLLGLDDGRTLTGVLRSETPTEIRIITADAKNVTLPKKDVVERKRGPSAMPQDAIKHLSKRDLRDLVEYLMVQPKN